MGSIRLGCCFRPRLPQSASCNANCKDYGKSIKNTNNVCAIELRTLPTATWISGREPSIKANGMQGATMIPHLAFPRPWSRGLCVRSSRDTMFPNDISCHLPEHNVHRNIQDCLAEPSAPLPLPCLRAAEPFHSKLAQDLGGSKGHTCTRGCVATCTRGCVATALARMQLWATVVLLCTLPGWSHMQCNPKSMLVSSLGDHPGGPRAGWRARAAIRRESVAHCAG
jgi:hypothetical protein